MTPRQKILNDAYKEIKNINPQILKDWRVNDTIDKVLRKVYREAQKQIKLKHQEEIDNLKNNIGR
jgi:hypothetical protein